MGRCVFCECDNVVLVTFGLSSECDIVTVVIDHKWVGRGVQT